MTLEPVPVQPLALRDRAQAANEAACAAAFLEYRSRRTPNTLRRQDADLALFAAFIDAPGDVAIDPCAWQGVTWGLVEAFKIDQLRAGYSIATVNGRLSTVRAYARLAMKAGTMSLSLPDYFVNCIALPLQKTREAGAAGCCSKMHDTLMIVS